MESGASNLPAKQCQDIHVGQDERVQKMLGSCFSVAGQEISKICQAPIALLYD